MRVYDYYCADCELVYEAYLKSDDVAACKECGSSEDQTQVITAPKIAFAKSDNQPQSQTDLANYLGSGKYFPGYKPSFAK